MRIFHPLRAPAQRYDASAQYAQKDGIIDQTRVTMERDSQLQDRCSLLEVRFSNGLLLKGEPQRRRVTVLRHSDKGDKKVARFDDAYLRLPQAGKQAQRPPCTDSQAPDCVVIESRGLTEYIDSKGGIELELRQNSGGPISSFVVRSDGSVAGDQTDAEPGDGWSDASAASAGAKGYYTDDVGNHYYIHDASGSIAEDGRVDLDRAAHPMQLTAFVSPQRLGEPHPPRPASLHADDWYARYDFGPNGRLTMISQGAGLLGMYNPRATAGGATHDPKPDPAKEVADLVDKVGRDQQQVPALELTDEAVKVQDVSVPIRDDAS